jgi:hypothetical protein
MRIPDSDDIGLVLGVTAMVGVVIFGAWAVWNLPTCADQTARHEKEIAACRDRGGRPVLKLFYCDGVGFYLERCTF